MATQVPSSLATIADLYRYPIKGMTGQALQTVSVEAGNTLPGDRIYAIENGPGKFSAEKPQHLPKINFVMLMRNARLAQLETDFDLATYQLTLKRNKQVLAQGDLSTEAGRASIEKGLTNALGDDLRGPPKIVHAAGHSFSDVAAKCVHIVNMASVRALEQTMQTPVDVRRFRPNIVLENVEAWQEVSWIGKTLRCGDVELTVFKRTERCQAVAVNPETAKRDIDIVDHLRKTHGHTDFGIYAKIRTSGTLHTGDTVEIIESP
jgi:MOSC domain-containing protein